MSLASTWDCGFETVSSSERKQPTKLEDFPRAWLRCLHKLREAQSARKEAMANIATFVTFAVVVSYLTAIQSVTVHHSNCPPRPNLQHSDLKSASNNARLASLIPARPALVDVLRVLSRNDLLASVGILHPRIFVWEEAIDQPVDNASSEERVDVANGESLVIQSQRSYPIYVQIMVSERTYRCWPPIETLVVSPPAT